MVDMPVSFERQKTTDITQSVTPPQKPMARSLQRQKTTDSKDTKKKKIAEKGKKLFKATMSAGRRRRKSRRKRRKSRKKKRKSRRKSRRSRRSRSRRKRR